MQMWSWAPSTAPSHFFRKLDVARAVSLQSRDSSRLFISGVNGSRCLAQRNKDPVIQAVLFQWRATLGHRPAVRLRSLTGQDLHLLHHPVILVFQDVAVHDEAPG